MTEHPWLTDPQYGGMSAEAARRSYEAAQRRPVPRRIDRGESPEKFELRKRQIEVQLQELQAAAVEAIAWHRKWKQRQTRRGFRCVEQQDVMDE